MKKKIIIHGSRVHDVGYRLALLQYAKEYRFSFFEAINTINDEKEFVCIYAEGNEKKIEELVSKIKRTIPDSALVNTITEENYEGEILPITAFSQDLQMEQMAKSVPILVEMRDIQKETLRLQQKTLEKQDDSLDLQHQSIDLQHETLDMQHQSIDLQHQSIDLQHETLDLQHQTLDMQHQSIDLQHETLDLQRETISEIKGLREDFRFTFDNRLKKIEDTLQVIITALERAKILG